MVTDDAMARVLHGAALREAGFVVEATGLNGDTLTRLRGLAPSVLLVDVELRGGQGFAVLREARARTETRASFIIALTSEANERHERKAAKLGADLILSKATTRPGDIIDAIRRRRSGKDSPAPPVATPPAAETSGTPEAREAPASPPPANPAESPAQILVRARRDLQILTRASQSAARAEALRRMAQRLASLAIAAGASRRAVLAEEAVAFSNALGAFAEIPDSWVPAANRTLAQALDLLRLLTTHAAARSQPTVDGRPRSVIIISADRDLAGTLQTALTRVGFNGRIFDCAAVAMDHLRREPVDLVAIDVNLPGMSSVMFCGTVREMPGRWQTPFLFLAAPADLVARSHMMLLGRADIVVHPTQPAEVILKVLTLVLQGRAERVPGTGADKSSAAAVPKMLPVRAPVTGTPVPVGGRGGPALRREMDAPAAPVTPEPPPAAGDKASLPAVLNVDESWRLISLNNEGRLLLGSAGRDVRDRSLREWITVGLPDSPGEFLSADAGAIAPGKLKPVPVILNIPGRGALPVRLRVSPTRREGRDCWLVLLRLEAGAVPPTPAAPTGAVPQAKSVPLSINGRLKELLAGNVSSPEASVGGDSRSAEQRAAPPRMSPPPSPTQPEESGFVPPAAPVTMERFSGALVAEASSAGARTEAPVAYSTRADPPLGTSKTIRDSSGEAVVLAQPEVPVPAPPPASVSEAPAVGEADETALSPEAASGAETASDALSLRQLRARATHLEKANATLQARLERSLEVAARSAAEAQREQSEHRRAMQQVVTLTARLGKLHDEVRDHLAAENIARTLQQELKTRCRDQAEALTAAQTQAELHLAEKRGLEERLRASQDLVESLRRQIGLMDEGHRRAAESWNDLEARLQAPARANAELSARLQEETAERRRLAESLRQLEAQTGEAARQSALEISRLRAELQTEVMLRSNAEAGLHELRCEFTEAEQASHSELNRLEHRLRSPANSLLTAISQLLESDLTERQRECLEAAVGNASLIRSHLHDLAGMNASRGSNGRVKATDASRPNSSQSNLTEPPGAPAYSGGPDHPAAKQF